MRSTPSLPAGNFQKIIIKITRVLLVTSGVLVIIAVTYLCVRDVGQASLASLLTSSPSPLSSRFPHLSLHPSLTSPSQVWPAISFGVVLLVASIPIAMQVVCTATMALGSRLLAAQRAIVARLSSIEQVRIMIPPQSPIHLPYSH